MPIVPILFGVGVALSLTLLVSRPARALTFNEAAATRWSRFFGVPVRIVLGVIRHESSGIRTASRLVGSDAARGGAWGLMQVTLETAKGLVVDLKKLGNPAINTVLARWDGTGPSLFDRDLNVMLGTFNLARDKAALASWPAAVLAFNRGRGGVKTFLAAGGNPANTDYVRSVLA